MGIEPTTPCLQSRCSSQLSYVPEGMSPDGNRHTIPPRRPVRSRPLAVHPLSRDVQTDTAIEAEGIGVLGLDTEADDPDTRS